jgi:hypothetical protein
LINRPATTKIENEDVRKYVDKYLDIGEWVLDSSIVFMNTSPYFERKNWLLKKKKYICLYMGMHAYLEKMLERGCTVQWSCEF